MPGLTALGDKSYFLENKAKPNLRVLCGALALRVLTETKEGGVTAVGVEFEYGGKERIVLVRKEVILSAG